MKKLWEDIGDIYENVSTWYLIIGSIKMGGGNKFRKMMVGMRKYRK